MANVTIQNTERERAAKDAKERAANDRARLRQIPGESAAANSVPALRALVAELCQIVERIEVRQENS